MENSAALRSIWDQNPEDDGNHSDSSNTLSTGSGITSRVHRAKKKKGKSRFLPLINQANAEKANKKKKPSASTKASNTTTSKPPSRMLKLINEASKEKKSKQSRHNSGTSEEKVPTQPLPITTYSNGSVLSAAAAPFDSSAPNPVSIPTDSWGGSGISTGISIATGPREDYFYPPAAPISFSPMAQTSFSPMEQTQAPMALAQPEVPVAGFQNMSLNNSLATNYFDTDNRLVTRKSSQSIAKYMTSKRMGAFTLAGKIIELTPSIHPAASVTLSLCLHHDWKISGSVYSNTLNRGLCNYSALVIPHHGRQVNVVADRIPRWQPTQMTELLEHICQQNFSNVNKPFGLSQWLTLEEQIKTTNDWAQVHNIVGVFFNQFRTRHMGYGVI